MITYFGINCRSPMIAPLAFAPRLPDREPFNLSSDLRALGFDAFGILLVVPREPRRVSAETLKFPRLRPTFP